MEHRFLNQVAHAVSSIQHARNIVSSCSTWCCHLCRRFPILELDRSLVFDTRILSLIDCRAVGERCSCNLLSSEDVAMLVILQMPATFTFKSLCMPCSMCSLPHLTITSDLLRLERRSRASLATNCRYCFHRRGRVRGIVAFLFWYTALSDPFDFLDKTWFGRSWCVGVSSGLDGWAWSRGESGCRFYQKHSHYD
jgi:uncharacterized protein YceK